MRRRSTIFGAFATAVLTACVSTAQAQQQPQKVQVSAQAETGVIIAAGLERMDLKPGI